MILWSCHNLTKVFSLFPFGPIMRWYMKDYNKNVKHIFLWMILDHRAGREVVKYKKRFLKKCPKNIFGSFFHPHRVVVVVVVGRGWTKRERLFKQNEGKLIQIATSTLHTHNTVLWNNVSNLRYIFGLVLNLSIYEAFADCSLRFRYPPS